MILLVVACPEVVIILLVELPRQAYGFDRQGLLDTQGSIEAALLL
jgi:hypothetical protein